MSTVKEALDLANPTSLPDMLRKLPVGSLLSGLIPQALSRTAFTSSATQIDRSTDAGAGEAGVILAVESPAGTALSIVGPGVAPGATEVAVAYSSEGVPTLTFNAAVTAYDVVKQVLPANLGTTFAADSGTSV
jgi:hypothetical protein